MKYIIIILFLLCDISSYAQIWKPVKNTLQAEYLVYQTTNKNEADIIAYEVFSEIDCVKPGMIFLAPPYYTRGKKISFVCNKEEADLVIYWTKNKEEVNWKIKKINK